MCFIPFLLTNILANLVNLEKENLFYDLKKEKMLLDTTRKKIYPFFLSFLKFKGEKNHEMGQIFHKYEYMPNYAQNSKAYFPLKNYAMGFQNMPNLSFWA